MCLVTAAILALNACASGGEIPPPQSAAKAAKPVAAATPQPAPAGAPAPGVTVPAPRATGRAAQPVAKTPAPGTRATNRAAPPVAARPAPAAAPALDLSALTERLKNTDAIGLFTKISLKNKVNDLLDEFGNHYKGRTKPTLTELRQSYDLLMMKVLSLLQDNDRPLAAAVVSSREAIWTLLADPKTFANLRS